jgi:hypothetical protein
LFIYYNIQSLDIIQMPRMPADLKAFEMAMGMNPARRWELTNTRYLLGPAAFMPELNKQLDPQRQSFRVLTQFDLALKPGLTTLKTYEDLSAVTPAKDPEKSLAIIEFDGALPRAKLYSNWVSTNDEAALKLLGSAEFDPWKSVLVANSSPVAVPSRTGSTNANASKVEFVSYAPKEIVFKAEAATDSILLLNDRYDPNWSVTVDDKPATLLRCNYIMRGVQLAPGAHTVRFSFHIPTGLPFARVEVEPDTHLASLVFHIPTDIRTGLPSYITLSAFAFGLVLIGALALSGRRRGGRVSRK